MNREPDPTIARGLPGGRRGRWLGSAERLLGPDAVGWVRRTSTAAVLLVVVLWGVLHQLDIGLSATLLASTVLIVALLRRILPPADATSADETPTAGTPTATGTPSSDTASARNPAGLSWWEGRLDWLDGDAAAFASKIQPRLAELVEARLRLRHGVNLADEPDRARQILGDQLWDLIARPVVTAPTPRELSRIIDKIDQL